MFQLPPSYRPAGIRFKSGGCIPFAFNLACFAIQVVDPDDPQRVITVPLADVCLIYSHDFEPASGDPPEAPPA